MKYALFFLSLLVCLIPAFAASAKGTEKGSILIVVTNHGELGNTGERTGYFLTEVSHPWHVFKQVDYRVEFASPKGGFAPMDPKSFNLEDPVNRALWHDLDAVDGVLVTAQNPASATPAAETIVRLLEKHTEKGT
jgi:putative intracellular protease/amidase